jgi:hypothetical protein
MPIQKKSINKTQKNVKKPAGAKARTIRLSGESLASTKQVSMKTVDVSSPDLRLGACNGGHH